MTIYEQKVYWSFAQFTIEAVTTVAYRETIDAEADMEVQWTHLEDEEYTSYATGRFTVCVGVNDDDFFNFYSKVTVLVNEPHETNKNLKLVQHDIDVPEKLIEFFSPDTQQNEPSPPELQSENDNLFVPVNSNRVRITVYKLANLRHIVHLDDLDETPQPPVTETKISLWNSFKYLTSRVTNIVR